MILYYVYFSAFCKKFFCRKGNYCENLLLQHWMYFRGRRFFRFLRLTGGEETKNFFEADLIIAHFCAMSTESFENIPPHMAIFQGLKKYGSPAPKLYIGGCATEVVDLKKRYPFVDGVFRRRKMVEDLSKYFGYDPKMDENLPINYYECVRIQTGCMRNCGFCKKGYLNMPLNSKTPDKVL